jgi:hypothetical protein
MRGVPGPSGVELEGPPGLAMLPSSGGAVNPLKPGGIGGYLLLPFVMGTPLCRGFPPEDETICSGSTSGGNPSAVRSTSTA